MGDTRSWLFGVQEPVVLKPPLVVCEVGISHNGSVSRALRTIDELAKRGVECVKFQTHIPHAEMTRDHPWWRTVSRCALTEAEERRIKKHAEEAGMWWLSTPYSVAAVRRLERLGVLAYKIGSGEVTHAPMLRAIRAAGKPSMMSVGMHGEAEVAAAVNALRPRGPLLLHCVSAYPTPVRDCQLWALTPRYGREGVGWSDHTTGTEACALAAALGAVVIEKHVALDDSGPDAAVDLPIRRVGELLRRVADAWWATSGWDSSRATMDAESDLAKIARHDQSGKGGKWLRRRPS